MGVRVKKITLSLSPQICGLWTVVLAGVYGGDQTVRISTKKKNLIKKRKEKQKTHKKKVVMIFVIN